MENEMRTSKEAIDDGERRKSHERDSKEYDA